VYVKQSKTGKLIVLCLYVDDTIIAYHKDDQAEWFADKKSIANKYPLTDMGPVDWLLNMKVTRDRKRKTLTLSQQAYVERILKTFYQDSHLTPRSHPCLAGDLTSPLDNKNSTGVPCDKNEHKLYMSIV